MKKSTPFPLQNAPSFTGNPSPTSGNLASCMLTWSHKGESSPSGTKKGKNPWNDEGSFFFRFSPWNAWNYGKFEVSFPKLAFTRSKTYAQAQLEIFIVVDFMKWTFTNTNLSQESRIGLSWASTKGVFSSKFPTNSDFGRPKAKFFLASCQRIMSQKVDKNTI